MEINLRNDNPNFIRAMQTNLNLNDLGLLESNKLPGDQEQAIMISRV